MKKEMKPALQKSLLGFASGVMIAASVWSLLIPSIEMNADNGSWSIVPAAVGVVIAAASQGAESITLASRGFIGQPFQP